MFDMFLLFNTLILLKDVMIRSGLCLFFPNEFGHVCFCAPTNREKNLLWEHVPRPHWLWAEPQMFNTSCSVLKSNQPLTNISIVK